MASELAQLIESRYRGRGIPVRVHLPNGTAVALAESPSIDIFARSWRAAMALASPTMGNLARAYVQDHLDFSGTARQMLAVTEGLVGAVSHGRVSLSGRLKVLRSQLRGNQPNIAHHYDVSNRFYALWLDRRMVYSCAYFRSDADDIDTAQLQKLEHICRKLDLRENERFLDIGCGWGALLLHAAQNYRVRATGITLSRNQYEHVRARVSELGLDDRVRVELRDYQDLPQDAQFDKIASVGMFEHVGVRNFPRYFGRIRELLRPGGLVLNHGITHNAPDSQGLGSGVAEFVEDYVFPGGELAHVAKVIDAMARAGLEVVDAEALREHYARTLWSWVDRLEANAGEARKEAGEERYRVWRIYMAGSAYAFQRGWLSLFQLLAGRPTDRGDLEKRLTREHVYIPPASGGP